MDDYQEFYEVRSPTLCLYSTSRREILQSVLQRGWFERDRDRLRLWSPRLHKITQTLATQVKAECEQCCSGESVLRVQGCASAISSLHRQAHWRGEIAGVIGLGLMRVQFGWPIGMPLVRSLKDGLWELRSTLPSQWLALAKRRMKEVTTRRRKTVILAHRWMSS